LRKVRLVADGWQHIVHGATYSATPSREELLILLHVIAVKDWEYYHLDEIRAFLNADRSDKAKIYAKFTGDPNYHEIVKSVYGLKTASHDHQLTVINKLVEQMCSCTFVKEEADGLFIVYVYVDDFLITGDVHDKLKQFIESFRKITSTTEPIHNADTLLGMKIKRDREKKIISVSMIDRITDLEKKIPDAVIKTRNVPMPKSGYLIRDHEYDSLPAVSRQFLGKEDIAKYLTIVGCIIWIQGVRLKIIFAVLYLSWFSKQPRMHHLNMALYIIGYLSATKHLP